MKYFVTSILLTYLTFGIFAQKALTFSEAKKIGVTIPKLDSLYQNGIHSDPKLAVFADQDEFYEAYRNLLQNFGKYLTKNEFFWDKTTMCFNRIYFDKNGKIDYFLYNFRPNQISEKREEEFKRLLNNFIQDYMFPLSAKVNFAQCSPVNYQPNKKKKG